MAKRWFVDGVEAICTFHAWKPDRIELFKMLCKGNMDGAEPFVKDWSSEILQDPRLTINDRLDKAIAERKRREREEKTE